MIPGGLAQVQQAPGPFAVFRRRNFSMLWLGQLIATLGLSLTSLAASLLVYRITGSAGSVGLLLIATAAPSLLVGLLAGALVDRFDRKSLLILSNLLRAILVTTIPILAGDNLVWLYSSIAPEIRPLKKPKSRPRLYCSVVSQVKSLFESVKGA